MPSKPIPEDSYGDAEAARRRDAITKPLIATPPQKHEPLKAKAKRKASPKKRK
jgi:hypothetical protein